MVGGSASRKRRRSSKSPEKKSDKKKPSEVVVIESSEELDDKFVVEVSAGQVEYDANGNEVINLLDDEEEEDEEEGENFYDEERRAVDERVKEAEEELRRYWDRPLEDDDTIDRIRKGEALQMERRNAIPYFAKLIGTDTAGGGKAKERRKWVYKLKNPLVEAYINIGRSHDSYMYPLHVDLHNACRANIISRLHASVRFSLDRCQWEVQVFGRNGVEFPSWGWSMPAEYDDEVWRPLRAYSNNKFTIGEVDFEIVRNPAFSTDRQMVEYCKNLVGVAEKDTAFSFGRDLEKRGMEVMHAATESAEEDADGKDYEFTHNDLLGRKISSVPPRGTTGQVDPYQKVIEDSIAQELEQLSMNINEGSKTLKKAKTKEKE
jgi:hypothetical protein